MIIRKTVALITIISVLGVLPSFPVRAAQQTLVVGHDKESLEYLIAPDRQYAAFWRYLTDTQRTTIELVPLDGRQPTPLYTQPSGTALNILGWTSDSGSVIVLESTSSNIRILRLAIDGSQITIVADQLSSYCANSVCVPPPYYGEAVDGALIYASYRSEGDTIVLSVFRTSRTGDFRSIRQIGTIAWSKDLIGVDCTLTPNGQRVVCKAGAQMVLMDTSGATTQQQRTLPDWGRWGFQITPDSRWMIAHVLEERFYSIFSLYTIPLDRDAPPIRLSERKLEGPAIMAPDGRSLLFDQSRWDREGTFGIYRAKPDGDVDSAELLVAIPSDGSTAIGQLLITADSQHLVYVWDNANRLSDRGIYSLALNQPGAQPLKLVSFGPDDMLDRILLAKNDQVIVYGVSNRSTYEQRIIAIPVIGPANAGVTIPTDVMGSRFVFSGAFGSHVLLSHRQSYVTPPPNAQTRWITTLAVGDLDGLRPPSVIGSTEPLVDNSASVYMPYSPGDGRLLVRERHYSDPQQTTSTDNFTIADLGVLHGGFAAPTLCVAEEAGRIAVPIELESAPVGTRTISYTISGGSADASDYTLPTSGTITIESGQRWGSLDVPIVPDLLAEGTEDLVFSLSSDPDSITLDRSSFTLTIRDQGACQMMLPLIVNPLVSSQAGFQMVPAGYIRSQ